MRAIFAVLFLLHVTCLHAQVTDKAFIDRWLKLCDDKIEVDSVRVYHVDQEYFDDTTKLNARLRTIPQKRIKSILYSEVKMDNYVPGKGTIYISTIQKMDPKSTGNWMKRAKELYVDKYVSFSQHILTDSKDPVLVIDGQSIPPTIAKAALDNIDPKEIYDISVNGFFAVPSSIFGQNARNGLVQIWTKQKYIE